MLKLSGLSVSRLRLNVSLAMVILLGASCGDPPTSPGAGDSNATASFQVAVGKALAEGLSRVEVVITGPGMIEIREDLTLKQETATATGIISVPAGINRLFTLNGYDAAGTLLYTGSDTENVVGGETVGVTIEMVPVTEPVVLTIRSPLFVVYDSPVGNTGIDISGEIENLSNRTPTDVVIQLTALNVDGAPMAQITETKDSIPPGITFLTFRFEQIVFDEFDSPVTQIRYRIEHSLGGPDTNVVDVVN